MARLSLWVHKWDLVFVPARRTSKTRKRLRRTHYKLQVPGMSACPNCGELKLSHRVCPVCGYYNGKQVKEIKVKEEMTENND